MALQNSDLLPLYRITDSTNRKISVGDFSAYVGTDNPPVIISDTPPSPAIEGELYWDTTDATLYVNYANSGNPIWVAATPVPDAAELTEIDGGIY